MKHIIYRFYLFTVLFTCSYLYANAESRIKTLIVTGQNNHNWKLSHIVIKQILENSGLFSVDFAISPESGKDMSTFILDFKPYQLVILDYNGDSWPEETNKRFVEYAKQGGGIVIYHAADNAFPQWKEFNEIIALGGWGNRNESSGPWVYWENGKLVKNYSPGSGGSHGAKHEFVLTERDAKHPITKGLPKQWKHAVDEAYDRMRGPGNIKTLLYTAFADPAKNGSGREEPLIFTVKFGKARIFHTMLGHAGNSFEQNPAMQCTGFQVTLLRGCEWAATGKVTQPVPDDFPTAEKSSLRPNYKPDH
ncbi:MAG: ThuA domain-containing protein [Prevotellaceae bacterium]|jgi:type 1 glutamine amidotransferase|nr:ThuA domain-containing protein [Prevotellaceae bacterium]